MDPITHTAIGLTVGQAGAKKLTKNWAWVMFFAASAPDGDAVLALPWSVEVLDRHRHFTHSPFFAPVMAAIVVAFVKYVLRRELQLRGAYLLALLGVMLHIATDYLTFRGLRLFMPFTDERFALQCESHFDFVLYAIFAIGFAAPMLSNLVSGEIGAKRSSGAGAAWLALVLSLGWIGARTSFHEQAVAEISSRVYNGAAPRRVEAIPTEHPFRFVGLVQGENFQKILDVNLLDYFDPEGGETLFRQNPSVEAGKAMRLAAATHTAQTFLAWARWPRSIVTRYDGDTRWVVLIEELAVGPGRKRPHVVVRLDENYAIQSEEYDPAKRLLIF